MELNNTNELQESIKKIDAISENKKDFALCRKLIHEHIKENLEYWRSEFKKHEAEQSKYRQSKYNVSECGYCYKQKYDKNILHIQKGDDRDIFDLVCKTCLFKNKIWK